MQGTGAGADMGGDAYEWEEGHEWCDERGRLEDRGRPMTDNDDSRPRKTETEVKEGKSVATFDASMATRDMKGATTVPSDEALGPLHDHGAASEHAGWVLAPTWPSRGNTADSASDSDKMEHEEWVNHVWALSASKQHADYEDEDNQHADYEGEYEGKQDCYGYHSRTQRDATAAESRRADAREQGCGARGSSPLRARELRNLQQNERADEGRRAGGGAEAHEAAARAPQRRGTERDGGGGRDDGGGGRDDD